MQWFIERSFGFCGFARRWIGDERYCTIHMWMRIVVVRQLASGCGSHSAGKRQRSRELWSHLKLAGEKLEEFP